MLSVLQFQVLKWGLIYKLNPVQCPYLNFLVIMADLITSMPYLHFIFLAEFPYFFIPPEKVRWDILLLADFPVEVLLFYLFRQIYKPHKSFQALLAHLHL